MTQARRALLGLDLGTSAVKVLACTPEGEVLANASRSYALRTPRPEFVELDAGEVIDAALAALRDVVANVHSAGAVLEAVGFSCAMHGVLPVDDRGEPLGPLVTWMDRRSAPIAERWRADGTAKALYERTGAPVHPMLPSCKLRWFAENDPALIERSAKFVSLKELLVFRWTGEWLIDWGMASGTGLLDVRARTWDAGALDATGIDASKLSKLAAPSTSLALQPAAARELGIDLSVVLASSDGALANLGVGATGAGDFALTLGTSGALRVVVDEPYLDPQARTFCYAYDDRRYVVGGATSSAGAVLEKLQAWFLAGVPERQRFERTLALIADVPIGAHGVTVVPFLSGERAPYWRADLHGAFTGLELSHTTADLLRAGFESVAFALRSVYDVLRERLAEPQRLRLSGGLTHAPLVRQLLADVFACDTMLTNQTEASAFGAAMMAGLAIGAVSDEDAVVRSLQPVRVHAPDATARAAYGAVYERYGRAVEAALQLDDAG